MMLNIFAPPKKAGPVIRTAPSDKRVIKKRRTFIDFDYLSNLKTEKRKLGGRRKADCMDIF